MTNMDVSINYIKKLNNAFLTGIRILNRRQSAKVDVNIFLSDVVGLE